MQTMLIGLGSGGRMRTLATRHALPLGGRLLELGPVLGEALDQAADQVVRPDVRDVLHDRRDIDDACRP